MNFFKSWVANIGYALVRWGQGPAYVVIYDDPELQARGEDGEAYYGYFSDIDEARHMFDELEGGTTRYVDPMLCLVIGTLEADDA